MHYTFSAGAIGISEIVAAMAVLAATLAGSRALGQQPMEDLKAPRSVTLGFTSDEHPRNTEGDVVHLGDGRLLAAWTQFYGGAGDFNQARIMGRVSEDYGRTWGDPFVVKENDAQINVMSVSLLRLDDEVALFFLRKNSRADCRAYMVRSDTELSRWHSEVCVTPVERYNVLNNDRVVRLGSGRLLAPTSFLVTGGRLQTVCWYSDDDGRSWQVSPQIIDLPKRGAMEPGVVELEDGRLLMCLRTQLGCQYFCHSSDAGITWTEPQPSPLVSCERPALVERIPSTGDLLAVWNHTFDPSIDHYGKATPLTVAVSKDGGETWEHTKNIEDAPDGGYSYPSCTFLDGRAYITYYEYVDGQRMQRDFKLTIIPTTWFYDGGITLE